MDDRVWNIHCLLNVAVQAYSVGERYSWWSQNSLVGLGKANGFLDIYHSDF